MTDRLHYISRHIQALLGHSGDVRQLPKLQSLFKRVGSNKRSTDEDELATGGRAGMRSALAASDNARTTLFKFKKGRGMVSLVE